MTQLVNAFPTMSLRSAGDLWRLPGMPFLLVSGIVTVRRPRTAVAAESMNKSRGNGLHSNRCAMRQT